MKVVLTGYSGFLGWHLRAALFERNDEVIPLVLGKQFDLEKAVEILEGADLLIHLAGVNRGTDKDISTLNIEFAKQVSDGILNSRNPPNNIVYANSIQSTNGSVYGNSKQIAGEIIGSAAESIGIHFFDVKLPNVYGEHGKPFYNSVTSTFCFQIANNQEPKVIEDKTLSLVHAQDVADLLIGNIDQRLFDQKIKNTSVTRLLEDIQNMASTYNTGELPDLSNDFNRNLFNTFRSYHFENKPWIELVQNSDERGSFTELVRSNTSGGQFSFSTTVPGVTRGEHFHRRKIERFIVLSGEATISVRKMFSDQISSFKVSGSVPVAIDMPTLSTHNIKNTGQGPLLTSFWINEIFDPTNPDTIFEKVGTAH